MTLNSGQTLQNRYRITGPLGQGGMGAVYQAHDNRLDHLIAVKEFDPLDIPLSDRQWATAAFEQEARMLAKLKHSGLTTVSDYFQDNDMYYLVMEFVEGETLDAAWQRVGGRFNETQVLGWADQLCQTLHYLHTQNPPIIFRDIKPSNIMIQPNGKLKLIDFGIARHFKPGQTQDTVPLGTPGYAPPEQHGNAQADPRSDVYALGATLHQLLTGHDPTSTPFHLPPIQQVTPHTSFSTATAITQALQIDMLQRPSDMMTFLGMLRGQGPEITQKAKGPSTKTAVPVWVWAVIGGLIVSLLILGVGLSSVISIAPNPTPTTIVVAEIATDVPEAVTASPIAIIVTETSNSSIVITDEPAITPIVSYTPTVHSGDSPNGQILFVSDRSGGDSLYMMDVSSPSEASPVTNLVGAYNWWPHWCGTDGIVFERADNTLSPTWMEIAYVADGISPISVTSSQMPDGSDFNGFPSCSPDGRYIAFSSRQKTAAQANNFNIGLINTVSSPPYFFTLGDGYALAGSVSWSPNSNAVVFMKLTDGGKFQIYRVSLDNPHNAVNLTDNFGGNAKYPDWSPDGTQVAFACSVDTSGVQTWSLCLTPADHAQVIIIQPNLHRGAERDQSKNQARHAITPSWSPDGEWIAFASDKDGDWDIYIYSLNTGVIRNLTTDWPGDEMHPDWGP